MYPNGDCGCGPPPTFFYGTDRVYSPFVGPYPGQPLGPYSPGCNPGVPPCSPRLQPQESVPSQLQNLETQLFGSFTITPIPGQPGRAYWSSICADTAAVPGYPRQAGEGFICYVLRLMGALIAQNPRTDANGNIEVFDSVNNEWRTLTAPNGILTVT